MHIEGAYLCVRPLSWGLGLLLLCAGCAPKAADTPHDAPNPNLHLALSVSPNPPTSLDPTRFTVRVTNVGGQPVSGADVVIRLAMPAMAMGDNQVTTGPGTAGTYAGTGRFTMAGDWQATVTATQGAQSATQSFPLRVK